MLFVSGEGTVQLNNNYHYIKTFDLYMIVFALCGYLLSMKHMLC